MTSSSQCVKDCPASSKPSASQECGNCGTQTRSVSCDTSTGSWTAGSWGGCTGQGSCRPGATDSAACDGGQTGSKTRACSSSCSWGGWDTSACKTPVKDCPSSSKPAASQSCGCAGTQYRSVTCNTSTGNWSSSGWGTCQEAACPSGQHRQADCCCEFDNCGKTGPGGWLSPCKCTSSSTGRL